MITLNMEIPKIDPFWDDQLVSQAHAGHRHSAPTVQQPINVGAGVPGGAHSPYERNLNFATVAVEDGEYGFPKKKTVRDPLSHRIIEKRRRDRMNNCLADLARLLPPSSLRKGRGRIEKTEIVELAIKHLRHLQCHPCPMGDKCEFSVVTDNGSGLQNTSSAASCSSFSTSSGYHPKPEEQFRLGFQECLSEAMHFLVEQEGLYAGDAMCVRLMKHLNGHCETVLRDHWGNQGKVVPGFRRANESNTDFKKTECSGGSISSGYHPNGSSSGSDGNGGNDGEGAESFALPVQNQNPQYMNVENSRHYSSVLDYEAENSCSSTPLSIETSDVLSDGKNNNRLLTKPPIPSIICSHSSNNSRLPVNSGSPANGSTNGRSSDDGSANSSNSSAHRYKFKSNIKQRFTADCQVKLDDGTLGYIQGNMEKSHGGAECYRDDDIASDIEEIREEQISSMDEGISCPQSGGDDCELKSIKENSTRGSSGVGAIDKATQQISTVDISSSSSPQLSLTDKTVLSSSATSNNYAAGAKTSTSSSLTATPTPLANNSEGQSRRDVEVKPSPEELLTAIHKLNSSTCGGIKNPLPLIVGGEATLLEEGKGIPAFALHEKGLFYIPLTIDKSIVSLYMNKLDSSEAPPLYPVTISVCFLPKLDKMGKLETLHGIHETEIVAPLNSKPADFSRSEVSPIPFPLLSGGRSVASPSTKSNRKGYREGNPFLSSRNGHQSQRLASKDSTSLARLSGTGNTAYGSNYKILPLHSSYLGSAYDFYRGSSTSSNSSLLTIPATGGTIYNGNYQDGNSASSSVTRGMTENNRGGESEGHSSSGCGRSSNAGGGDGSSSGSSGVSGSVSRSRKRSFSSSPSISGGSLGYHSWHDKTSPNSPDFYNYHLNTHNLQAMTGHGHCLAPVATPPNGQILNTFHGDNNGVVEKQTMGFGHDKRSKKTRSIDQRLDTK